MMPVDDGSAPPSLAGECDVAMSVAPESSAVVTATSIEGAANTSMSRYLDFPGIGIIDLDAIELPSNDREILEAVTEWVFADPPLLNAIASDPPVPRQDGDAGGSAPSAAPEVAEGLLGESTAGTESAAIERPQHLLERARTRPCSSPQRQPWPRPLFLWSVRSRESSEERGHRPPSLLLPPWRRFQGRASSPPSLRSTMPPRVRQELPPPRVRRPRGREKSRLPGDPRDRGKLRRGPATRCRRQ
jgi:hypothetical protein